MVLTWLNDDDEIMEREAKEIVEDAIAFIASKGVMDGDIVDGLKELAEHLN